MMTIVNHDHINSISHRQQPIKSLLYFELVQRKMAPNRDERWMISLQSSNAEHNEMHSQNIDGSLAENMDHLSLQLELVPVTLEFFVPLPSPH